MWYAPFVLPLGSETTDKSISHWLAPTANSMQGLIAFLLFVNAFIICVILSQLWIFVNSFLRISPHKILPK